MKAWQKAIVSVAGGVLLVGGLGAVNRLLLLTDLPPTLPGALHDWSWRGWRVRYTMLGNGDPVVLVHGIHAAASSYEWSTIFEPLSARHTVLALDLIGFGKSERPAIRYSGHLYADLLTDFLGAVVGRPATLVASSLGSAYAVAATTARPDLVRGLVLISPTGRTDVGPGGRACGRILELPLLGTAAFNGLVSRSSIRYYLNRVYADPANIREALVEQNWATSHQPNARLAPAAFLAGRLDLPFNMTSGKLDCPVVVLRGDHPGLGRPMPDDVLSSLGEDVTVRVIEIAGQVPHDEAPERVSPVLEGWMDRTTPPA